MTGTARDFARQRDRLDFHELELFLRDLGLAALIQILTSTQPMPRFDLKAGRNTDPINTLAALLLTANETHRLIAGPVIRMSESYLVTDPQDWTVAQRGMIAAGIGPRRASLLRHAFLRALRQVAPPRLPEAAALATALGHMAWCVPEVRLETRICLNAALRSEVVLYPRGGAAPDLSAPFWWLIVGATCEQILSGLPRRSTLPLRKALRETAVVQAATKDWAGFWEMYLLRRSRERGFGSGLIPPDLPLLKDDPLAQLTAESPDDANAGNSALRAGWQAEAPPYARSLLSDHI